MLPTSLFLFFISWDNCLTAVSCFLKKKRYNFKKSILLTKEIVFWLWLLSVAISVPVAVQTRAFAWHWCLGEPACVQRWVLVAHVVCAADSYSQEQRSVLQSSPHWALRQSDGQDWYYCSSFCFSVTCHARFQHGYFCVEVLVISFSQFSFGFPFLVL